MNQQQHKTTKMDSEPKNDDNNEDFMDKFLTKIGMLIDKIQNRSKQNMNNRMKVPLTPNVLEALDNHGIIERIDCDRSVFNDELVASNIAINIKKNIDTPDDIETSEVLVSNQSDKIESLDVEIEMEWDEEIVFDHLNIDTQVSTVTVDLAVKACITTPFAANTLATQSECTMELMGSTLPEVCEKAFIWKTSEEFSVVVGNEDESESPAERKGRVLKMPWDPGVVYQKGSSQYFDTQDNEQFSMRFFFFFFEIAFGLLIEASTQSTTSRQEKQSRQRQTLSHNPAMAHGAPPDPTVLDSKLDRYPDEAWGWELRA